MTSRTRVDLNIQTVGKCTHHRQTGSFSIRLSYVLDAPTSYHTDEIAIWRTWRDSCCLRRTSSTSPTVATRRRFTPQRKLCSDATTTIPKTVCCRTMKYSPHSKLRALIRT